MNQLLSSNFHFHSALAILEPQIHVVAEQFEAESISLLSGRLVLSTDQTASHNKPGTAQVVFFKYTKDYC